jgi:fructose-1,6-bisphosphatase/inositol monophosphatase family enzyme
VTPDRILEVFAQTADDVRAAVGRLTPEQAKARTARSGQYGLDVVADVTALRHLHAAGFAVMSEESGYSGPEDSTVTVVLDPVDGSTNCARGISYWAISLCALDADGPLASMVVNQATGTRYYAMRGAGAFRDGKPIFASGVERVEDAVVALSGFPARALPWKQFRALGCAALALCDLAAGGIDGYVDGGRWHAPWDYLGGYQICTEAGAVVADLHGDELVTTDVSERRQLVGGATAVLRESLVPAAGKSRR